MSRSILSLSPEQLTSFDLKAFVSHANALNQQHLELLTTPFPKTPSRGLSHYQFTPRPVTLTCTGHVDGDLSGLIGATIDFTCPCREARAAHPFHLCTSLRRPRRTVLRPGETSILMTRLC